MPASPSNSLPPSPTPGFRHIRLPSFNKDRPKIYFQHIEALFRRHRVSSSYDRYDYLVPALSSDVMDEIQDVIEEIATTAAGDPYERTKERLLLLYAPSRWVMASRILHHPHLGDTRPSVLMSKMLALLPRGEPPGILFQTAWLEWLPAEVRSQVSTHDFADVRAMAAFADRVWETRSTDISVAALSLHHRPPRSPSPMDTRSQTPSRASSPAAAGPTRLPGRQRGTLCFYHCKWGMAAATVATPVPGKIGGRETLPLAAISSTSWTLLLVFISWWTRDPPAVFSPISPQHRLRALNSSPPAAPLCRPGESVTLLCPFPPTNLPFLLSSAKCPILS